jgi:hypothetical protein
MALAPLSDPPWSARSAFSPSWPSRRRDPLFRARFRVGVQRDVGDDRDDVRALGEAELRPLDIEPADGNERNGADAALPFADALEPCGAKAIALRIVG